MKKFLNTLVDSLSRNADFMVKTITIGGTVLAMLSVIIYLQSDIDKKIYQKLSDPEVIRKIANEIKSPSIIFYGNGKVVRDDGGAEYVHLDKIEPEYHEKSKKIIGFTITTKIFLTNPPIITSIDGEEYFHEAERIDTYKWKFKTVLLDKLLWSLPNNELPIGRYKLEIVR